jgi:hypothetical protein
LVKQHSISFVIDMTIMLMQSSTNPIIIFEDGAAPGLVVSLPIQEMVKEVVILMQSPTNTNFVLEGDASFSHVIRISSISPYEQEIVLLSSSTLPPSLGEVPFD